MSNSLLSLTTHALADAAAKGNGAALGELRRRLAAREADPRKVEGSHVNAKITARLRLAVADPARFVSSHLAPVPRTQPTPVPPKSLAALNQVGAPPQRDSLKALRAEMDARFARMDTALGQLAVAMAQLARKAA
jgi:hypothetical protein